MKQNKSISIHVFDKEITHGENFADVTASVLLLGSGEWLPERGQIYNIASRWIKEGNYWKMRNLRWEKTELKKLADGIRFFSQAITVRNDTVMHWKNTFFSVRKKIF